ncbi:peroxiredoxin family protein [Pedobacter sp. UYP24]
MYSKILIICFIIFGVGSRGVAQTYSAFKLSTDKPETGKQINFVYTGVFSKKVDPRITLYYSGANSGWLTLKAKFDGQRTVGSFVIPDSVLAIGIVPRNSRDSNEVFTFPLYNKGILLKGALATAAKFISNISINYREVEDVKKARMEFLKEFEMNPELRPTFLLKYYETGAWFPDPVINLQFQKTWVDSLVRGTSQKFLTEMYYLGTRFRELNTKDLLKGDLLAKYPQAEVAFADTSAAFIETMKDGGFEESLIKLEHKFADLQHQGKFDRIYLEAFKVNFEHADFPNAEKYLSKIKSDEIRKDAFLKAAKTLLKNNQNLPRAEFYTTSAIALLVSSKNSMPYYIFDKQKWLEDVEAYRGNYLGLLAEIQHKQGNTSSALQNLAIAEKINDWDEQIKEHYVQYLLEEGKSQLALEVCSGYIKRDKETVVLKKLLFQAFEKVNGENSNVREYYNALIKEVNKKYALRDFSMLNVRARDFTLKDMNDQPVTYKVGKGVAAVLYFFSPNDSNAEKEKFNAYFNEMAVRYAGRHDVVFYGVDKTSIFDADENKRLILRKQKIQEFRNQYDFKFNILLDDMIYNSKNSNGTYFIVSDNYSCEYRSQFYMIDKDGIVRYKQFPPGIDTYEKFEREFSAALNLIIK